MPHRNRDGLVSELADSHSQVHDEILADYSIGAVQSCQSLKGGMFLRPLLVVTETGKYVLRGHTFRTCEESFRFQAEALEQLWRKGIRCSQVILNRFGKVGQRRDSVFWALYDYLEGHMYSWEAWSLAKSATGFLEKLGFDIASIHGSLASVRPGGDGAFPASLPPIQFTLFDRLQVQWKQDMGSLRSSTAHPMPRSREVLLAKSDEIEECWRFLSQEIISHGVDRLPKQLLHGDVSPVNMVFEERSSRFALIDWDCLHHGVGLYDALGDVLNRPPLGLAERFDFQPEEVRRYLTGYQDGIGHKISRYELRCVPLLCMARQLEDLRQRVRVLASLSSERDEEFAILIRGRIRMMNQIVGLRNQFPSVL